MASERENWRMRYEHQIVRDVPIERPLVVPAERRVIVLDPEDPLLHQQVHEGDFATGLAALPRHPEDELSGRFARGQQLGDPGNPNEERLAS
jgi:hypothetical protein